MVFSYDARHLTSYESECEVSKSVKSLTESKAYFKKIEEKYSVTKVKPTDDTKPVKPYR